MGDAADDAIRRAEAEQEDGVEIIEVNDNDIGQAHAGALVVREVSLTPSMTVDELVGRRDVVVDAMNRAMEKDVHYGTIPGVQKPSLLKPGAEMLNVLFQLAPSFPDERQQDVIHDNGHRDVKSLCVLTHIPSGLQVAEAHGACSTREKKYAYRVGALTCPECGASEIRKSKQQGKDEWYCWRKQGGCGATFPAGTEAYETFVAEQKLSNARVDNPDLPDTWNTVVKMSEKRALIAATLLATGASDVFTQDVEDAPGPAGDSSTREPVRSDPPLHPPIPKNATEVAVAFEKIGIDAEWISQAIQVMFGSDKTFADLDQAQRNLFGQRMGTVFVRMYEGAAAGEINIEDVPGPKRGDIRRVFASVLEGVELPGPPWQMHPPTYDADEASYPVRAEDEPDPDAEAIEFGEADYPVS